jgi:SHS2 domain-containing protein
VLIEEQEGIFRLEATVSGEQIDAGRHHLLVDVKAVTLHHFQVAFVDNLWKAVVVLDV